MGISLIAVYESISVLVYWILDQYTNGLLNNLAPEEPFLNGLCDNV